MPQLSLFLGFLLLSFPLLSRPMLDLSARQSQYPEHSTGSVVVVDIATQSLLLFQHGKLMRQWLVSTSRYGIGNRSGSNQTPLGAHYVRNKIGAGAEPLTIFRSRKNTGKIAEIENRPRATGDDYVTTRILWLSGLEPGKNQGGKVDSYSRYIYIHGTHEEGLIGQPASHGCIRMRNADVIELFDLLPSSSLVLIEEQLSHELSQ
jgi:hypothetical protein